MPGRQVKVTLDPTLVVTGPVVTKALAISGIVGQLLTVKNTYVLCHHVKVSNLEYVKLINNAWPSNT